MAPRSASTHPILTVATQPFTDQKPGTSGLRKKVARFQQSHYLANFIQACFNALAPAQPKRLLIGGDGRYFNDEALQLLIQIAIANGVETLYIGQHGLLSTPAASALIRERQTDGGFILSASHNPAGPSADFGIKYNTASGSPAPESLTDAIYRQSLNVEQYRVCDCPAIDLSQLGSISINQCSVEVIDSITPYINMLGRCFDFDRLRTGFEQQRLALHFDALHAITGPYAKKLFEEHLGAAKGSVIHAKPLPDFGGGHPDPNLVHAHELVTRMYQPNAPVLGAASDGDGDRNMIMGSGCFVSPSDSLAVIAEHHRLIPQFADGLTGAARSMPTSSALDHVCAALDIDAFETPTGWKFFGTLLDADRIQLCGEESFGTGANHIREKDGLWAVLCWLTLINELDLPVAEILQRHWQRFGRAIYCRHDYEGLPGDSANQLIAALRQRLPQLCGLSTGLGTITAADEFSYRDPVDQSLSEQQGLRIQFDNGGRIIYRLSGTGTDSATLRIYLEQFSQDPALFEPVLNCAAHNASLGQLARELARMTELTGRTEPSVIT